ncbi:MAG: translation initiation factor IF-3 [Rhodovibrio sp.]|nr:translation initiation factor IF-3 [Rhodovibrio sp.]
MARPATSGPPTKGGPRVNDQINVREVRLIGPEGENLGVLETRDALEKAGDFGLDLVEVSPNVSPPVCRILDYGRYKYEEQKKRAEARKKQKTIELKEIKMRPNIDDHDYGVKMKAIHKFLDEGDKVKVTLRFRGREMAHQELGKQLLGKVQEDLGEKVKVEAYPKLEGRQMIMVLAPR